MKAAVTALLVLLPGLVILALRTKVVWTSSGLYPAHPLRVGEIGPFAYVHGADTRVGAGFHAMSISDWGVCGYWVMIQSKTTGVSIGVNIGQ